MKTTTQQSSIIDLVRSMRSLQIERRTIEERWDFFGAIQSSFARSWSGPRGGEGDFLVGYYVCYFTWSLWLERAQLIIYSKS